MQNLNYLDTVALGALGISILVAAGIHIARRRFF